MIIQADGLRIPQLSWLDLEQGLDSLEAVLGFLIGCFIRFNVGSLRSRMGFRASFGVQ